MKKQYVIPIFVPHLGCPNDCIFCNQKSISGKIKTPTEEELRQTIDMFLNNFKEEKSYKEIAFFGGSFTGIEVELQERFLKIANEYIKDKKVDAIRISTRPDYIDKDILKRLKKYNVKTIELGVQSANDYILKTAKRGHTFEDVKRASKMIRWYGFKLGHQMMIGLPDSTKKDEINTAKALIKLKPKMMRIYPVLVIKNTTLAKYYEQEKYEPLTLEQAVERSKELIYLFNKKKIKVIRVGLQNTETITDPESSNSEIIAGPYHPAFRQLVESNIWYDTIAEKIKKFNVKVQEASIEVNPIDVNNAIGHKKENIEKFKEIYDVKVKVIPNEKIKQR